MVSSFSIFRKPNTQLENNTFRPNKKIPVFKVTRLYLYLLVKTYYFFFKFSGKIYNFMHFERRNDFQNA